MHAPLDARGMTHDFGTLAAGVDPAAHRYDPITRRNSDTWLEYVSEVYDPTIDNDEEGGEVSEILGDAHVLEREPKDATERRFSVRALPRAPGVSPTDPPTPPAPPRARAAACPAGRPPPTTHAGLVGGMLEEWCRALAPTHIPRFPHPPTRRTSVPLCLVRRTTASTAALLPSLRW